MNGPSLLSSHLALRGLSRSGLAARLKVARSLVSMWLSGERVPGLQNATAIEKETGVPHTAWIKSKRSGRRGKGSA